MAAPQVARAEEVPMRTRSAPAASRARRFDTRMVPRFKGSPHASRTGSARRPSGEEPEPPVHRLSMESSAGAWLGAVDREERGAVTVLPARILDVQVDGHRGATDRLRPPDAVFGILVGRHQGRPAAVHLGVPDPARSGGTSPGHRRRRRRKLHRPRGVLDAEVRVPLLDLHPQGPATQGARFGRGAPVQSNPGGPSPQSFRSVTT